MEERTGKRENENRLSETRFERYEGDEDEYSSNSSGDEDDDEMYLKPGEPYGTTLQSPESPYDRSQRVEELNIELSVTRPGTRTLPIRVKFREDLNQYFHIDDSEEEDKLIKKTEPTTNNAKNVNGLYKHQGEENWRSTKKEDLDNTKRRQSGSER